MQTRQWLVGYWLSISIYREADIESQQLTDRLPLSIGPGMQHLMHDNRAATFPQGYVGLVGSEDLLVGQFPGPSRTNEHVLSAVASGREGVCLGVEVAFGRKRRVMFRSWAMRRKVSGVYGIRIARKIWDVRGGLFAYLSWRNDLSGIGGRCLCVRCF